MILMDPLTFFTSYMIMVNVFFGGTTYLRMWRGKKEPYCRGDVTVKEEPDDDDPYDLSPTAQVKWDPPADAAKRRSVPGGCDSKKPRLKRFPHL